MNVILDTLSFIKAVWRNKGINVYIPGDAAAGVGLAELAPAGADAEEDPSTRCHAFLESIGLQR